MWANYVYELRDPDTMEVFYVGKGTDYRVEAHKPDDKTEKSRKIAEIYLRGKEPLRIILGRFENEQQAFAVEATLIKWVYGKNKLTNIIHGHSHRFIRAKDQLINNQLEKIEGIDIPPRDGMNIMRLVEYDKAIAKIREKSNDIATAIEELVSHFIKIVDAQLGNVNLIYRASETRLSFFAAEVGININLQKRQPADPVARIFLRSPLNKGGRLHLSFNRDPKTNFSEISNTSLQTKLGVVAGKVDLKKIDVLIKNPINWRDSEELINNFLLNAINHSSVLKTKNN